MGETHYEVLGLDRDASSEEIRQAYFRLARQYHPDSNPLKPAADLFIKAQLAYDVLNNSKKRREYDLVIEKNGPDKSLLDIVVLVSTTGLICTEEPQLIYALMEISPHQTGEIPVSPPAHFCFVVDRSSSMKGERIEMVKESLKRSIENLQPNDLVSIVCFNDFAEVFLAPTRVSELTSFNERINDLPTSGGTEIYVGLKTGVDLLWHGRSINYSCHLILLTDGHTYGDEEKSLQLAQSAGGQGIVFHTIGFGHEWNDLFLDRLAILTGGSSIYAYQPHDLNNYLSQISISCKNLFAKKISMLYTSDQRVKLKSIFRIQPEVAELDVQTPVLVGDLHYNMKTVIFMEFKVDSLFLEEEQIRILIGSIEYETHFPLIRKLSETIRIISTVKKDPVYYEPPAQILRSLSMIRLYQMQEKAREEVRSGQVPQAVKHLELLAVEAHNQGDITLEKIIKKEAEIISKKKTYSSDGEKRIKYGTRTLLKLPAPEKKY